MNTNILDVTPGCIVAWSSDTPRPPERFKNKLSAWERDNGSGRVIAVRSRTLQDGSSEATHITVAGKVVLGASGAVVARFNHTKSVHPESGVIEIVSRPAPGNILIFESTRPTANLVHVATNAEAASEWLSRNAYPSARLEPVASLYQGEKENLENEAGSPPNLSFDRSTSGLDIAIIGDSRYIAHQNGDFAQLLTLWRSCKPVSECTLADFYSSGHFLESVDQFHSKVIEIAQNEWEKARLGRCQRSAPSVSTPWGSAQTLTVFADGIESFTTAEHGGFRLSPKRNAQVHPAWRADTQWYEEDCEWAIVAHTFPDYFTAFEQRCAVRTLRDQYPDEWELVTGEKLTDKQSRVRRERSFFASHRDDWIVYSALYSHDDPNLIKCHARKGRGCSSAPETREFLVPRNEYCIGEFGFVIDTARHTELSPADAAPA